MYVSGNVGIGTTVPTQKLDVNGTTKTTALQVTNGVITSLSTANLSLQTNSTTRMTILNSGNVGIGTTAPSQTLDVIGTTKTNVRRCQGWTL